MVRKHPLFKTRPAVASEAAIEPPAHPAPTQPGWHIVHCASGDLRAHLEAKNAAQRPPLPDALEVTGLPTLAAALAEQKRLSAHYRTRCGSAGSGFYVRGANYD